MNLIKSVAAIATTSLMLIAYQQRDFGFFLLSLCLLSVFTTLIYQSRVAVVLASASLSLALCEFALSYLSPDNDSYYDPDSTYQHNYFKQHPKLGYSIEPGSYKSKRLTADGELIYDVSYTIGTDGFRNDTGSNTKEVAIFGGSFVFGEGINDDSTLAHILYSNHGIEAKITGFMGMVWPMSLSCSQIMGLSSNAGNMILLTAPWHAFRSSCKALWLDGAPRFIIEETGNLKREGFAILKRGYQKILF